MPSIAYDTGQNIVTIAYYSTKSDTYKNRVVMAMNQIASGSITPGSTAYVISSYDSMEGDGTTLGEFFGNPLGDFMGLAAHGGSGTGSSRVYWDSRTVRDWALMDRLPTRKRIIMCRG